MRKKHKDGFLRIPCRNCGTLYLAMNNTKKQGLCSDCSDNSIKPKTMTNREREIIDANMGYY